MKVNDNKENIRGFGFFSTLFLSLVGFGVFTYSQNIGKVLGTTGILMTLLYGLGYLFFVYMINKVIKLHEYKEFDKIIKNLFGKFIGRILLFLISFCIIFLISIQLRIFIDSIKMYIFQSISSEFMITITLFVCYYVVRYGNKVLVGLNEITFVFLIICSIIIFLIVYKNLDFTNILPFEVQGEYSFFMGFLTLSSFFSGIIILFYLLPKYKLKDTKKIHITYKAVFFSSIFLSIVFLICVCSLNIKQTIKSIWPIILSFTTIDIKGGFVGRVEGIIITIAIIFFIINFINLYFYASLINSKSLDMYEHKISSTMFLPIIYIVSLIPKDLNNLYFITNKIASPICLIISIFLPIVLLIATYVRSIFKVKGDVTNEKNNN